MPTTFAVVNFVNKVIDTLTGAVSTNSLTLEGTVQIYSGTQPADPTATPAGTLLATVTVAGGAWGSASAGIATLGASLSGTGTATGTASFARLRDQSTNNCIDVTCGVAASGAGCILDTLSITSSGAFMITNLSVKIPASLGTLKLNTDARNKMVNIWTDVAGALQMGVSGTISVYSGSQPATPDTPATGTKLVDIPTGGTCPWSAAVGGAAALASNLSANAVATNTAGYARWTKGLFTVDGSVGTSAADFILDSLSIVNGNPVTLTDCTVSF